MTTPPRTEALDKVIRNLDWHIEHKAHAGIGPIVVRHWNLLRERLTGGVAQGRVVSPQSAEELDAILNSGSNALCTVHPDGSVTTDDTCQCPKCGRMHRRLGTPPASIAAPAEAAGEAVAWTNPHQLAHLKSEAWRETPMAMWAYSDATHDVALYAKPPHSGQMMGDKA